MVTMVFVTVAVGWSEWQYDLLYRVDVDTIIGLSVIVTVVVDL